MGPSPTGRRGAAPHNEHTCEWEGGLRGGIGQVGWLKKGQGRGEVDGEGCLKLREWEGGLKIGGV